MRVVRDIAELDEALAASRRDGATIGLVPTMGALHDGHLSLVREACRTCEVVVVTLFVNPAQFGPGEDFGAYPRTEEADLALLEAESVDVVYAPEPDDVYPPGFATTVAVGGLTEVLCGHPERRGPEHFAGVTTVVAKLFNVVGPDVAFFGQKDAQQVAVIRRMARDLGFPVRIEALPTVREPDGLALSSRNRYLDADERRRAAGLNRALEAARSTADAGAAVADAIEAARRELDAEGIEPEYVEARDAEDLTPAERFNGRPVLVALAARVGSARLIDNVVIEPRES
jgi:pantoate--beta-alanine ligase